MQPFETNALARQALDLLSLGLVCVPLLPSGKHLNLAAMGYEPLHLRTHRKELKELAFTSATFELSQRVPQADTVAKWFAADNLNIGIVGGVGGLLILDFDDAGSFDTWREECRALAATSPCQRTPHGFHLFLRCGSPIVSSSLHHGFRRVGHVKALGGYVVAAPSRTGEGGSYEWVAGQSPWQRQLQSVPSLESLGLHPGSPGKRLYDRLFRRGSFESR